jgi:allophanate hydrolase
MLYAFKLVFKIELMNESNYSRAALSVRGLLADYERKATTPSQVIKSIVRRIEENGRPEIWTLLRSTSALNARAAELDALLAAEGPSLFKRQPLFGVPFAVKDNVDVAGLPTTAACKEFAYVAQATAFAVQRLLDAGAILIGKTNLDQFATGLVGTRSPFGAVRQVEFPERVSGGSSSGSAAAVAAGCVAFSLGTDTAGSGRVPAGFNELVGLKPTLGLVSKRGVVPACRSLDTLSIFTHDVADAWHVLSQMAGFDALDSYSRQVPALGLLKDTPRVGIPDVAGFFDDSAAEQAFAATLESLAKGLSITPSPVPFAPLKQVSALLYDGPWVAERRAALGDFFETHHDAIHPVVAKVIGKADRFSAVDAFIAQYELADLKRQAEQMFRDIDVLIVPTTPTHPLIADVLENPIELNSQLGLYTNFVNLLDLCALAVPCLRRGDGLPAGITLIAPAGADHRLAVLGARIQALFHATSAGGGIEYQPLPFDEPTVTLAVVGAHLRGQPLNWQLLEAGARFVEAVETTSDYQLFALANTTPPKPGLARVASKGKPIAVELWEVPVRQFGALVARVPAPLGIGTVQVAGGAFVKSFICEPWAIEPASGARDITEFGGWLAYLDSLDDQAQ